MKSLVRGTSALFFAAAILFATTQPVAAFSWYTWGGPGDQKVGSLLTPVEGGRDITDAYYAADGDYRYFRMDLKGTPNAGSNGYAPLYQFTITTPGGSSYLNTYGFTISTLPPTVMLTPGVIPSSPITEWYYKRDDSTPNRLEWAVKRTDLPDTFAWQAFTWNTGSVGGPINGIFDLTPAALATPIPSAALLLGTGLIGLVGLRRRGFRKG